MGYEFDIVKTPARCEVNMKILRDKIKEGISVDAFLKV